MGRRTVAVLAALGLVAAVLGRGGDVDRLVRGFSKHVLSGALARAAATTAPAGKLTLVKTVLTRHGNAAQLVWSDDGKALFLANEEGTMSAVKIDVSDLAHPRIVSTQGAVNFLWAVDQRNGLLAFHPSYGDETVRIDPRSFALLWKKKTGSSHAIATDGSRIFLAREGKPGVLLVLDGGGRELAHVSGSGEWAKVYGMAYEARTHRLYVAAEGGSPGGIDIYDAGGATPVLRGTLARSSSDIAVSGTRLWRQAGNQVETWDLADPAHPALRDTWESPSTERDSGGRPVPVQFGRMTVNRAGTRLYLTYTSGPLDRPAGFKILDVSGATPRPLAAHDWKFEGPYRLGPTSVALSPDDSVLAVSYWAFGVRLFKVAGDTITDLGMIVTTGEAHDVYVDQAGILYVFANDNIQIIDPATGEHLRDIPVSGRADGGWKPFKGGLVVLRGPVPYLMSMHDGNIALRAPLQDLHTYIWDNAFEDPYLYSGGEDGTLFIQKIAEAGPGAYRMQVVGSVRIPRADGSIGGGAFLMGVAKSGPLVWAIGPTVGVAAVDVRDPAVPRLVFHDKFTFKDNGTHVGLVGARGRVYAGAGDHGVIIYDAATFRRTGSIGGLSVDFLDKVRDDFLVVANYWYPQLPEGVYVYDLRGNPDAPAFVGRFPEPEGSANFRVRVFGSRIYRVALGGVDILEAP